MFAPPSNHGAFEVRIGVDVDADVVADLPGLLASVPEVHDDGVVGRAGHDPDRNCQASSQAVLDDDEVSVLKIAVFAAVFTLT
jgi:hypothetical protein